MRAGALRAFLQHIEFRQSPCGRHTWLERRHHGAGAAHREVLRGQREIDFHGPRLQGLPPHRKLKTEIIGQHAGNGHGTAIHGNGTPDHTRVGGELVLEQVPGEHHAVLCLRPEQTPERRPCPRQRPEIAGDRYAAHLSGILRNDHRSLLRTICCHACVRLRMFAPIAKGGQLHRVALDVRIVVADPDQALRMRARQRTQ